MRSDLPERPKDEFPLGEPGVGEGQVPGPDAPLSVKQDVQVYGAWPPFFPSDPPQTALDGPEHG